MTWLPSGSVTKSPPAKQEIQETCIQPVGQEDPLEKEMATYSSILAWEIPWTEEPGGLHSMGLQRVGHDLGSKQRHQQGTMTYCLLGMSPSFLKNFPTRLMAFTSPAPTLSLKDSHPHIDDLSTVLVSKPPFSQQRSFLFWCLQHQFSPNLRLSHCKNAAPSLAVLSFCCSLLIHPLANF